MKKVVITQSIEQTKDFVTLLNSINLEVTVFPVIKVVPLPINQNLKEIFFQLETYDWVLFNSINSVRYFFFILMNQFLKFPRSQPKIACLGQKTVDTLKTYGKNAQYFSENIPVNSFYQSFMEENNIESGNRILVPLSREELNSENFMKKASCDCSFLEIYETKMNSFIPQPQIEQILSSDDLIITFFNPLAVENFLKLIPANKFKPKWSIIAGGDDTAEALGQISDVRMIKAKASQSSALFEEVKRIVEV